MKSCFRSHSTSIYRMMLRGAALLVPHAEREEWLMEWESELWHLVNSSKLAVDSLTQSDPDALRFCLGSFRDAIWLRRNHLNGMRDGRLWLRSPVGCLAMLAILAAMAWLAAFLQSLLQPPYTGRQFMLQQSFVIGTALLLLRIGTAFTLGEYPATPHSPARATFYRWIFLAFKIALILPIVFFGTFDLGPVIASAGVRPHATMIGYVLAFRWVVIDQRRRCPVCLRVLTNPVRIGRASHTMLDWYGMELICSKGHGLLHVPETRTSAYGAQQWLYLDSSWRGLFS